MSKPTTNTDGKNTQHKVKVLQSKGFSKDGAADIAQGKTPSDAADRSMAKGKPDPAPKEGTLQSNVLKKKDDTSNAIIGKI